jgi:hypothetical protein
MSSFVSALELQRRTSRSRLAGGAGLSRARAIPAVMRGMAPRQSLDVDTTLFNLATQVDAALVRDAWRFSASTLHPQTPPEIIIAAAGHVQRPNF